MMSVIHLCRCSNALRLVQSKLLVNTRKGFHNTSRQLITSSKYFKPGNSKFKLTDIIQSNRIIARFCSSSPKQKPSKLVGYWLLTCSGMVFTAVVLGMVVGYLLLLYSIYYVINILLKTSNGSK